MPGKVAFTAALVLLIWTLNVPSNETSGMFFTSTVAPNSPASPALVMISEPLPFVTETNSVVPSPRLISTFRATMRITWPVTFVCGLRLVIFSNAKSPLTRWPSSSSVMPVPATLRYGPATRSSVMLFSAAPFNVSAPDALEAVTVRPRSAAEVESPSAVTVSTFAPTFVEESKSLSRVPSSVATSLRS